MKIKNHDPLESLRRRREKKEAHRKKMGKCADCFLYQFIETLREQRNTYLEEYCRVLKVEPEVYDNQVDAIALLSVENNRLRKELKKLKGGD